MLLYPPMKDLLRNVDSRYMLVNIVANRARKISSEAENSDMPLTEKPVSLAILEGASGALRIEELEQAQAQAAE